MSIAPLFRTSVRQIKSVVIVRPERPGSLSLSLSLRQRVTTLIDSGTQSDQEGLSSRALTLPRSTEIFSRQEPRIIHPGGGSGPGVNQQAQTGGEPRVSRGGEIQDLVREEEEEGPDLVRGEEEEGPGLRPGEELDQGLGLRGGGLVHEDARPGGDRGGDREAGRLRRRKTHLRVVLGPSPSQDRSTEDLLFRPS